MGVIGPRVAHTYDATYLGAGPQTLKDVAAGQHAFSAALAQAKQPMIIVGAAAAARADGAGVLAVAARLANEVSQGKAAGWNIFNVLHAAASRVAGLDLGFVPEAGGLDVAGMTAAAGAGKLDVLWLLGADEIDMSRLGDAFVIYQGTHGDAGAHRADVILPGAAYTEKSATYVNFEGRAQTVAKAVFAPGEAKEDWTILRALSGVMGKTLPYDTLSALRAAMYKVGASAGSSGRRNARGTVSDRRARGARWERWLRAVRLRYRRFLSHQSDCESFGRHGGDERAQEELPAGSHGNAWIAPGPGWTSGRATSGRCW